MDFPFEMLSQAKRGRSVSGEDLEAFGKKAAEAWSSGDSKTLTASVVETVKHAGLTPEQVRRVVEFANTSAYLGEFNKEGSIHRVIDFHGGPADAAAVLQDLNDGGGGSVNDHGSLFDYQGPPSKTASVSAPQFEEQFDSIFSSKSAGIPEENPLGDLIELREKVAALHDHLTSEIGGLEVMHMDLCQRLFENVKQAALEGNSLGEVVRAWSTVTDEPIFFKTAFDMLSQRLVDNGVFRNLEAVHDSLEKTGSPRLVNMEHPMLHDFQEYCECLEKLSNLRPAQAAAARALQETTESIVDPAKLAGKAPSSSAANQAEEQKLGAGGLVGRALAVGKAARPAGEALGKGLGELAMGKGHPVASTMQSLGGTAAQYAPHAIGAALALRALEHAQAAGQSPLGREVKSFIPGTQDYEQKKYELQQRYGAMPQYY